MKPTRRELKQEIKSLRLIIKRLEREARRYPKISQVLEQKEEINSLQDTVFSLRKGLTKHTHGYQTCYKTNERTEMPVVPR